MLELKNITKSFGAVKALKGASLSLAPGEIRAFLGANGSGKSTIVKTASGLVRRDSGSILVDGREVEIRSPREARALGIDAAYQDLSLVPRLSIEANVALGREARDGAGRVSRARMRAATEALLGELGLAARPDALVADLDPSERALVELAKALAWEPRYLIADELTASLHRDQVERVFAVLRRLRAEGKAILFVSHRLDEVLALCSAATILRGGETVAELPLEGVTEARLVELMTGCVAPSQRSAIAPPARGGESKAAPSLDPSKAADSPLLEVRSLSVGRAVHAVDFSGAAGEIVGIAGLQGQGQAEFLRALYGAARRDGGTVLLGGKPLAPRSPADAVAAGLGFIPGDREREGVFGVRPIYENIYAARSALGSALAPSRPSTLRASARSVIERLKVVASGPEASASSLSGGNQQKLVVGRWLELEPMPRVILLDDPTKGVDIAARRELHELLRAAASRGALLLYSSSDDEELVAIADRIIVFYEGRIVAELRGAGIDKDRIAAAALGSAGRPREAGRMS